jgi:hypothetical protein
VSISISYEPPQVSTLCKRYSQALISAQESSQYFEKLTSSVTMNDQEQWEQEIQLAESCRLADPSTMDILQVRGPEQNIEPNLAIEEGAHTLVEEWIQMALNIEEKQ